MAHVLAVAVGKPDGHAANHGLAVVVPTVVVVLGVRVREEDVVPVHPDQCAVLGPDVDALHPTTLLITARQLLRAFLGLRFLTGVRGFSGTGRLFAISAASWLWMPRAQASQYSPLLSKT